MNVRIIIDKKQVDANHARARWLNVPGADFLLARILDDLDERLAVTNKSFAQGHLISDWAGEIFVALEENPKIGDLSVAMESAGERHLDELGLKPASTDLLIDLLTLHQANDVPGMLIQSRRAMRPDGLYLACVPGGDTLLELRQSLLAAEAEITGGARPRVLPFMDVRDAGGLLQRAGFTLPVADIDTVTVRYETMFHLMRDLRAMGATNTLAERSQTLCRRDLFAKAAAYYAQNFCDPDGRIRATFSFIWMSGWGPAASQPKALKPGSAQHSLATALKDKSG